MRGSLMAEPFGPCCNCESGASDANGGDGGDSTVDAGDASGVIHCGSIDHPH